ncbi:MAG TPA: type II secretion system F family protein [Phycisphaerae bacterium]|nr:type II secretion system F family protein [Phycisphaerae bacterium]
MTQLIILLILVIISVMLIVYSFLPDRRREEEQMLRRMTGRKGENPELLAVERRKSAATQVLDKVTPLAMKPLMPRSDEEMSTLRGKLAQAGYRSESAVRVFLASKTVLGGLLAVLTLIIAWSGGYDVRQLFGLVATAAGIGFMLPNGWLWLARSQRAEKIRNGLPDSLDLLVVCVESGLALDAGLQRVSEEMRHVHPELSEELQITTLENQMGVPRSEALEHMARRAGIAEMNSLVAVITQAERFGTSVAQTLRTQADMLRIKRRLKAEERAQKTTVKLMLPLILFIFPSIFVVLVGPAVLQLVKTLGSGGGLGG